MRFSEKLDKVKRFKLVEEEQRKSFQEVVLEQEIFEKEGVEEEG